MKDIAELHLTEYDSRPESVAEAPAIVKLLGEHTDAAEGLVLAAALSCRMRVAVSFRKDASLRFLAADFGERKRATAGTLKYKREDRWANHVKAMYEAFAPTFAGRGVNVTISGDIPLTLNLGASAALGLASALAFSRLLGSPMPDADLAALACRAESAFFERSVPLYNYLAATVPKSGSLALVDLRSGKMREVPPPGAEWVLVLTDSRVPRASADAELRDRAEQCRRCLAQIPGPAGRSLRDVKLQELDDLMGILPESMRRRCLHVIEEIARVSEAEEALHRKDAAAFGRIMNKSHASLRGLYEVSCPEVDWLVKRAMEIDGMLCSRMTGKGFGGCTASFMKHEALAEYRKRLEDYERIFGFKPHVYETEILGGIAALG